MSASAACYHLPGLFEFYDFYRVFLPLFRQHREYFYDWCRMPPCMAHRRTASGAAAGWGPGTGTPGRCWP